MYVLVAAGTLIAILVLLRILGELFSPLLHVTVLLLLGATLALALAPAVRFIHHPLPRPLAVAIVVVGFAGILAVFGALTLPPLLAESEQLSAQAEALRGRLESGEPVAGQISLPAEIGRTITTTLGLQGGAFGSQLATVSAALVSGVVDFGLVVIIAIYLLIDAPRFRILTLRMVPLAMRSRICRIEEEVRRVFGGYLRGQLILAATITVAVGALLLVLGVPYALPLAVFAGAAELIPMFGPIIGAVPALLVSLALPWPTPLWVALGFLLIQQVESNVLVPRISGHAVGIHPLAAMLTLVAGFQVAGLLGALFAVPTVGLLWAFIASALAGWRGRRIAVRKPRRYRVRSRPAAA